MKPIPNIKELFAFVYVGEDEEGIVSLNIAGTEFPMVGGNMDPAWIEGLKHHAKHIARTYNKKIVLKKFKLVSVEGIEDEY